MSKVYYVETKTGNYQTLSAIAKELLHTLVEENNIVFKDIVPIKVHFGEAGNETYIPAIAYDEIIDYIQSKNIKTAFIETNVLYRGKRTNKTSHIELAKKHGFTRIPIIIADGESGENYVSVDIDKKYIYTCFIGAEFQKYNQYIITSHFKGHVLSGFGAAVKQLSMGFAARGGKLAMHSMSKPKIDSKACTKCGVCSRVCAPKAILSKEAQIDHIKCIGCAICIAVCPINAIHFDWQGSNFNEKLAEYAYGAALGKQNIYINFVSNITADCDCLGKKMSLVAENIGVTASLDPVAIDIATLDLVQSYSNNKIFDNGRIHLKHAEMIGLGTTNYELVRMGPEVKEKDI